LVKRHYSIFDSVFFIWWVRTFAYRHFPRDILLSKLQGECLSVVIGRSMVEKWQGVSLMLAAGCLCAPISFAQVQVSESLTRASCLECHTDLEEQSLNASAHKDANCIDCHSDIKEVPHQDNVARVNCSTCHEDEDAAINKGIHAQAGKGGVGVPSCSDCHGTHNIFPKADARSQVNHFKSHEACLKCHTNSELIKEHPLLPSSDFVNLYKTSVHGKGVTVKGLSVSATCTDCHGPHTILPASDPESQISKKNVPVTCSKCHMGIYDQYAASIHGKLWLAGRPDVPVCTSCHSEHGVVDPMAKSAQKNIPKECGQCHQSQSSSYADTFHGKATSLGFGQTAKCSDCHSAHNILPASDPSSMINKTHLQKTCAQCHTQVNEHFTEYDPHINPHDKKRSAFVYFTYQFMKWLLVGVFGFWGLHTSLWFQRSVVALIRREFTVDPHATQFIRRFTNLQRKLHGVVVTSFLGLVMTGLPLKYYYTSWGQQLNTLLGGVENNRYFHRIFGLITLGYFLFHLIQVACRYVFNHEKGFLRGPNSLMPRMKDWTDFVDNIKWFFYTGDRPKYDRWTYFEKFDYLAVFWGVFIIGSSGLVMWFPVFFTQFLPGSFLNVAAIVHSDEALLALAFIFTVHFFHNHLRVENFPIDLSIFSGVIPLERFMKERPQEYERLVREGKLQQYLVPPPSRKTIIKCFLFGFAALTIGFLLIIAIFITYLSHHNAS
jgi:cytochrome b subunit of formate dehydrogenase